MRSVSRQVRQKMSDPVGDTPTMQSSNVSREEAMVPRSGEEMVLQTLQDLLKSAKESPIPEVSRAARKWESAIVFRIKVEEQRVLAHGHRGKRRRVTRTPARCATGATTDNGGPG